MCDRRHAQVREATNFKGAGCPIESNAGGTVFVASAQFTIG
jgi:hypothetical protein